jgi:hypothetical protein
VMVVLMVMAMVMMMQKATHKIIYKHKNNRLS